jgi:large conductance mechanosensitive channel
MKRLLNTQIMNEFKKFINKGNVIEMAVGLIMATYFGAIVKSLVNDVIMPPIGMLLGGVDFSALKIVIQPANEAESVAEVALNYGAFINTIITFLLVAFAIFLVVRFYNRIKERFEQKEIEAPPTPQKPSKEEELLTEIRDLLKKK